MNFKDILALDIFKALVMDVLESLQSRQSVQKRGLIFKMILAITGLL